MLVKLGPWCHDRRRLVLGLWLALLVFGSSFSSAIGSGLRDDFNLPDVESKAGFVQKLRDVGLTLVSVIQASPDEGGAPALEPRGRQNHEEVDIAGDAATAARTARRST